ncbi:hypothetical protein HF888_08595 [Bermanella marisrubri]|uniref:Exonuclease domain-containing protein n=1 Tax=Bermanella marisrubri TaxID=207949 RepID=Q1N6W1_9GAMM|nr:hypothetical protein [Bermanella marisrubri]EAT13481.1 hypothetical protein RED65_08824 [Oceanobacter sp. RED65] [Bermanella marisrubri]QIZ84284.1 hypothetical protein HF888_08595 [Bermanella marisrubri]
MEYPRFLVLEANSFEENAYPIAASWSIADGQLKAILIHPEEEWTDWDSSNEDRHGINREQLTMTGETVLDVIRELNEDVDKQPVYVTEPYLYSNWLNTMYDAYGSEVPFDLITATELFGMTETELDEELENLSLNLLLDSKVPEDKVKTMLELYQRLLEAGLLPEASQPKQDED